MTEENIECLLLFCVLFTALIEDKSAKVRKDLINKLGVYFFHSLLKTLLFNLSMCN